MVRAHLTIAVLAVLIGQGCVAAAPPGLVEESAASRTETEGSEDGPVATNVPGASVACNVGADCESGVCRAHVCVALR